MKRSQLDSISSLSQSANFMASPGERKHFRIFAILVWCSCVIPSGILFLTSTRAWQETIVYTSATQLLRNTLILLVSCYSLYLILRYGTYLLRRPFGYIFIAIAVIFFPTFSGLIHENDISRELVAALITTTVALALFSIKIEIYDLKIFGVLGGMTGLLSLAMALFNPSGAYIHIGGSRILAGPFENSNYLGIILLLFFPFILLIKTRLLRYGSAVFIILPIIMGGSETALGTLLVLIITLLGKFFLAPKGKNLFFSFAILISFLFALLLPFFINDPEALSRRGAIWQISRSNLTDVFILGGGLEWFAENSQKVGFSIDHTHNLFLEPLFIGGITFLSLELILLWKIYQLGTIQNKIKHAAIMLFLQSLILAGATGDFFIMDARDLRFFASGFIIISLVSIATNYRPSRRLNSFPIK